MIQIANHLWQSTLFLAIVALLTFALRKNRAHVRYCLWLAASLKFLLPFALLTALGSSLSWRSAPVMNSQMSVVIDLVSQPFSPVAPPAVAAELPVTPAPDMSTFPVVLFAIWVTGCAALLTIWLIRWRRIAAAVRSATPVVSGREWEILRRLEENRGPGGAGLPASAEGSGEAGRSAVARSPQARPGLRLVSSTAPLEPGVFGLCRLVLFWPRSLTERLSDEQIEAIFAHELTHVRRRDNLAAAMHMFVQAVFWFHPLVWWVGARLIDERERACDEEVIRQGSHPQVYAESILRTVEFHVESPLACLSGVTGSDLKKRIEQIMRSDARSALTGWRKLLLAAAAVVAIAGPIAVGLLSAPPLRAQAPATTSGDRTFEVASVKRNKSGGNGPSGTRLTPGGQFVATNVTLRSLIQNAYGMPLQPLLPGQLVGAPDWVNSEHFDIVAKAEGDLPPGPGHPLPLMIRALLAERFKLAVHNENRALPIYALLMARTDRTIGPQMKTATFDCSAGRGRNVPPPAPPPPGERPLCGIRLLIGKISAGGVTMAQFANALSRLVGRVVVDKTELSGGFDLDLQWTPDPMPSSLPAGIPFQPPVDPNGPSIFTATQEQLGLKLESQNSGVDVLVIDRVEPLNAEDEFVSPPPPPPPPPPPRG